MTDKAKKLSESRRKAVATRKKNKAVKKAIETRRRRQAAKIGSVTRANPDKVAEERFFEVKAYEEKHGVLPPVTKVRLGKWLSNMRQVRKGNRGACSYPKILDKLCKQYGKKYFESGTNSQPFDHKSRAQTAKKNIRKKVSSKKMKMMFKKKTLPSLSESSLIDFDYLKKNAPKETISREKLEEFLKNLSKTEKDVQMMVELVRMTRESVENLLCFLENF